MVAPIVSLGLAVLTVALVLVGLPLVVAPSETDRYFAWTIDVPLTAAFLGACYWTAALFTLLAARERSWARMRSVMPGVLVAGTLILVATLIHLDRFAMDFARGWVWLILYAGLPPGVLILLALQRRLPVDGPPVQCPIAASASLLLAIAAGVLLLAGVALFAFPGTTADRWPWPLTELTARMVGAWLTAVGVTLAAVRLEADRSRTGYAMAYLAAFAVAQLVTLARYSGTVEWDGVAVWIYVAVDIALLALAASSARLIRPRKEPANGLTGPEVVGLARRPRRSDRREH